ncbi:MAG: glycosyltransferase family 39 protein [Candidatus Sumerlaeia bacterium]|nr:glycosyltransferase family 39 protein [Candidatus Sumerlaeia bacterium]
MSSPPRADIAADSLTPRSGPTRLPWDTWLTRWRWAWIPATVLLGLWLRFPGLSAWWVATSDQGRYLSFAEQIRRGHWAWSNGYDMVSTARAGFSEYVPPLYPLLSGLAGVIMGDVRVAGTAVNLTAGLAVIVLGALLALRISGATAGLLTALALACHPLLINFSTNRYTEILFAATLLAAALATWEALERPASPRLLAAGLVWAVSGLARFEGQTLFGLTLIYLLLALRPRRALTVLAGHLILSIPFRLWAMLATPDPPQIDLSVHTLVVNRLEDNFFRGPYLLDGDGHVLSQEIARGASFLGYLWSERGFYLDFIVENLRRLPPMIAQDVLWGGLWIAALLGGLCLLAGDDRQGRRRWLVALAAAPLGYLCLTTLVPRLFLGVLPLHLILAAAAVVTVARSVEGAAKTRGWKSPWPLPAAVIALCAALAFRGVTPSDYYDARQDVLAAVRLEAMAQIARSQQQPPRIVSARDASFGFHSEAQQIILPYADREATLRFLRRHGVRHLLVDNPHIRRHRPEQVWLTSPEALAADLRWVARDPEGWSDLYEVHPEPRSSEEQIEPAAALLAYGAGVAALRPRPEVESEIASVRAMTISPETLADWELVLAHAVGPGARELWGAALAALDREGTSPAAALRRARASAWHAHSVARWLYEQQRTEQALAAWELALETGPPHEEYALGLCRSQMRLGRNDLALEAARRAIRIAPDSFWAHLSAGDAARALQRFDEARAHWRRAAARAPFPDLEAAALERLAASP